MTKISEVYESSHSQVPKPPSVRDPFLTKEENRQGVTTSKGPSVLPTPGKHTQGSPEIRLRRKKIDHQLGIFLTFNVPSYFTVSKVMYSSVTGILSS